MPNLWRTMGREEKEVGGAKMSSDLARKNEEEVSSASRAAKKMKTPALVRRVKSGFQKIRAELPYILELKHRFAELRHNGGGAIDHCLSWKTFCIVQLHRSDRAIRYAIAEALSEENEPSETVEKKADNVETSQDHLKPIRDLREKIETNCPGIWALIRHTPYGVVARLHGLDTSGEYDLQLRRITAEQIELVCKTLHSWGSGPERLSAQAPGALFVLHSDLHRVVRVNRNGKRVCRVMHGHWIGEQVPKYSADHPVSVLTQDQVRVMYPGALEAWDNDGLQYASFIPQMPIPNPTAKLFHGTADAPGFTNQ